MPPRKRQNEQLALMSPGAPDPFAFEGAARRRGFVRVAGVDEAGRGPLAGPVVAAAVILPDGTVIDGVGDSKLIPEPRREALFEDIHVRAHVGVGLATHAEIDRLNILRASLLAMVRAVEALPIEADHLLIDGNQRIDLPRSQQAIVGGDGRSASIGAASIVAKVTRDRMMRDYCARFPGYGFSSHKGYATPEHYDALRRLGASPIHRLTFNGVRDPADVPREE